MKLVCPECKSEIPLKFVDLRNETAFCCRCQKDFGCKDWIETELVTPENLRHPPHGASYEQSSDGFEVVVSARSYNWFFLFPFACPWSALVLFFSYAFFHAPPEIRWMLFLFLITPFALLVAVLWTLTLMSIFGKIRIVVDGNEGNIFNEIGPVGWRRRFNWDGVEKVRLGIYGANHREQITLEGDQIIQVARGIKHERLCYLLIALRQNLKNRECRR